VIDIDLRANRGYYAALLAHSRLLARAANTYAAPNPGYLVGAPEIPHNLGGVPVGTSAADGVVDDRGRVFGIPGLHVLDGSILPATLGPNPALTIAALAERAMALTAAERSRPAP
jgi:cholesterol oxidase